MNLDKVINQLHLTSVEFIYWMSKNFSDLPSKERQRVTKIMEHLEIAFGELDNLRMAEKIRQKYET